jgi:Family of unknown function (DUF5675)
MELYLKLVAESKNSTLSKLWLNGQEICFILEDGSRETKEYGKTRIPSGRYKMAQITQGRFFTRYKEIFGFAFALGITNVLFFENIRIHAGNSVEDTLGCLLTGTQATYNKKTDCYEVTESLKSYSKLWKLIQNEMKNNNVFINIERQ